MKVIDKRDKALAKMKKEFRTIDGFNANMLDAVAPFYENCYKEDRDGIIMRGMFNSYQAGYYAAIKELQARTKN